MKPHYRLVVAAALLWFTPGVMAQAQTQPEADQESVSPVVQLLEESGYRYTKETPWLWSVPFKGNYLPQVAVWVMTNDDEVIVEGVVARRDQIGRVPDAMRLRLIKNETADGLALLLDEDGNYVARSRLVWDALDASTFQSSVQAIATATDAAYGAIQGFVADGAALRTVGVTRTFDIPPGATTDLSLLWGKARISFNPTAWKELRSAEAGKRTFQLADGGGFAMVVAERIEIPLGQLRDRALANMRETASDVAVVDEQHRRVNGTEVLSLQTNVTVQGVPFTYLGYYYGGPSGTVQVVTYTERAKFEKYQRVFEEFLNGLSVGQ